LYVLDVVESVNFRPFASEVAGACYGHIVD
jgi:hypothetical protein